jgi:heme o synthase
LLGTLLVASGTGTLNQYIERNFDAQMRRTARRPAAAGRLKPSAVLAFGTALAAVGSIYLAIAVNLLASALATFTLVLSVRVHAAETKNTNVRSRRSFSGRHAAADWLGRSLRRLNIEAGILYAMLFLWQFPHFMAIAWMYREDYDRAGYLVLPKGNARVPFVMLQTLLPLLALVAISIMQSPARHAMIFYCAAVLLGTGFHVLRMGIRIRAFESCCTPAADGLDCLSSTVVRIKRDVMQSGQMYRSRNPSSRARPE